MRVSDINVTDATQLTRAVLEAYSTFQGQVWWRGQRRSDWSLTPRVFQVDGGHNYEQNAVIRFMQRAPSRHPHTPGANDYFPWLFLMQHYRLPTRLLDWTESPLAGAYFAAQAPESPSDGQPPPPVDGALYALNPYILNLTQVSVDGLLTPEDSRAKAALMPPFSTAAPNVGYVLALLPSEVDLRMLVQQSVFTIHPPRVKLEDLPQSDEFLIKYPVPAEAKDQLLAHLKHFGVHESSLFPDLEHLAREVRSLRFGSPKLPHQGTAPEREFRDPAAST